MKPWLRVAFWLDEHLLHPLHWIAPRPVVGWLTHICYLLEHWAGSW